VRKLLNALKHEVCVDVHEGLEGVLWHQPELLRHVPLPIRNERHRRLLLHDRYDLSQFGAQPGTFRNGPLAITIRVKNERREAAAGAPTFKLADNIVSQPGEVRIGPNLDPFDFVVAVEYAEIEAHVSP